MIFSAWKPNNSTTVANKPMIDQGFNVPSKPSIRLCNNLRVMAPATNGSRTYNTTDKTVTVNLWAYLTN